MINPDIISNNFLKEIADLNLKDYDLIKVTYNFFIWKKQNKKEYLRLCLIQEGFKNVFYWNLELSFKPFAYKHNHRENANLKSKKFKVSENKKYFNYFLEMINKIKEVEK